LAIGAIEPARSHATHHQKPALGQHREMMRDGWSGYREFGGDVARCPLLLPYKRQDLSARPVCQRSKHHIHAEM